MTLAAGRRTLSFLVIAVVAIALALGLRTSHVQAAPGKCAGTFHRGHGGVGFRVKPVR